MTTRFATSPDSTRIAFDVTGAGTPLLLLHGGGGSRAEWHEGGYVAWATSSPSSQWTCAATAKATSLPTYTTEKMGQDILAVIDACNIEGASPPVRRHDPRAGVRGYRAVSTGYPGIHQVVNEQERKE